jgi:hypothetical protein
VLRSRRVLIASLSLAACLVAMYGLLPWLIERKARRQLSALSDGYLGDLKGVDLRLWRAEVAIQGLRIEKFEPTHIRVPFLRARELVLGFTLDALHPRSTLRMLEPVVHLVDGPRPALDQWGPDFDLRTLREQLPFELESLEIERGAVHLHDFHAKPEVDARVEQVNVHWRNLAGCLPPGDARCRSRFEAEARLLGQAPLTLRGRFERRPNPELVLDAEVKNLAAKPLSPLLIRYAEIDLQGGRVDLTATYRGAGAKYSILIVPRLEDMEVMGGKREATRFGREMGVALVAGYFERKRGKKAVRLRGTQGRDDLDFDVIDTPGK